MKKGAFIAKGEELLRIEPAQSRLAVEEVAAEIQQIEAQVGELDRKNRLFAEGIISKSSLDQEKQRLLVQKNTVENYKGILNRLSSERRALLATLAARKSRQEDARLNLGKTVIKAPFDSRLSEVNVEIGQAAQVRSSPGQSR